MTLFDVPSVTLAECHLVRTHSRTLVSRLVAEWHSVLPLTPFPFRLAFLVIAYDLVPVAVATWNHPSARMEDHEHTFELIRLAHGPQVPKNTGSWALGQMRRWIRENMPEITRLISYQDANVHHGTIYKADNWHQVYEKVGESTWGNRPGRRNGAERTHKIKWERKP